MLDVFKSSVGTYIHDNDKCLCFDYSYIQIRSRLVLGLLDIPMLGKVPSSTAYELKKSVK